MPWKESSVMDERLRFVASLLDGQQMSPLCREFRHLAQDRIQDFRALQRLCARSSDRPVQTAGALPAAAAG
jgi:hypothetical protein